MNLLNDIISIIKTDEDVEKITLKNIINGNTDSQYLLILVISILIMCPIPILSTILAIINSIISYQMLIGRKNIKLPKKLLNLSINKMILATIIEKLSPFINKIEKITRNRLIFLTHRKFVDFLILVSCLLSISPVPFLSTFSSISTCFIIFGYLNKDGFFIFLGIISALLNIVLHLFFLIVGKALFLKILNNIF